MAHSITPYLIVAFVAVPLLGILYVAPLILARRWWGTVGLWIAAVVWWTWMGWAMVDQDPSILRQAPDDFALTVGMVLAFATIPAYIVDRVSRRSPLPSVWKRLACGIAGMYVGFVVLVLIMVLAVLVSAWKVT